MVNWPGDSHTFSQRCFSFFLFPLSTVSSFFEAVFPVPQRALFLSRVFRAISAAKDAEHTVLLLFPRRFQAPLSNGGDNASL